METHNNDSNQPSKNTGPLTGREDEREHNIDAGTSIKEMREGKKEDDKNDDKKESDDAKENDALNYKNDREHGAYNPKNI